MTTTTPFATQGFLGQPGVFGQGFSPYGIEPVLGVPQQQIFSPYGPYSHPFTQQYGVPLGLQVPFGGMQPHHIQQAVHQAAIQVLPYVQQSIMPQVVAQTTALVGQQVQQQVPQIVAQLVLPYLSQLGQPGWQQAAGFRPF